MRLMLFVLSIVMPFTVLAARPLSGMVTRGTNGTYLQNASDDCARFLIVSKSDDAAKSLRRLSNGDTITGSGTFDSTRCEVQLESVEYVGLKKLLGYWYSQSGIMTVKDFNSLSFYPINLKDLSQEAPKSRTGDPINYRYSVTPSGGEEWVVFLSDKESTTFATISLRSRSAVLKIYDSETGVLTKTLRLSKWGTLEQ